MRVFFAGMLVGLSFNFIGSKDMNWLGVTLIFLAFLLLVANSRMAL